MITWQEVLFQTLVILASVGSILFVLLIFYWFSKKQYKQPKLLPFCPKCGSTALVALKKDVQESYFAGSLHSNHSYACQSCGFEGACALATKEEIAAYKNHS